MRERLRWFGYVQRKPINTPIRKGNRIILNGTMKARGRPKQTWMDTIKKCMLMA